MIFAPVMITTTYKLYVVYKYIVQIRSNTETDRYVNSHTPDE